ncbi:MAG TPA: UDP-glucose 4-epimerase GalE [Acidobacteriota bacterium]|nr:UDP-glucose 4-epimerase GalE [Acidobacteriota bacterium]
MKQVLVTGGAGYIGSHTVHELASRGYQPIVMDNLSQGHPEAVDGFRLEEGDLNNADFLNDLFTRYEFEAVIHFASHCYVGESMENPALYYEENLGNALRLLAAMLSREVKCFILSSTCATYGEPQRVPIDESHPQDPVNPYGETKYFIERILKSYDRAYGLRSVALRYFNAAGASISGELGESHNPETHLIPRVLQSLNGKDFTLEIYGDDYPTPDGTCIRDYIHVEDLASAHVKALDWLAAGKPSENFNLGTGTGSSVLEVVRMVERKTGKNVSYRISPRRPGDPPVLVADAGKAKRLLGWSPQRSDLDTIIETAWKWEQNRRY